MTDATFASAAPAATYIGESARKRDLLKFWCEQIGHELYGDLKALSFVYNDGYADHDGLRITNEEILGYASNEQHSDVIERFNKNGFDFSSLHQVTLSDCMACMLRMGNMHVLKNLLEVKGSFLTSKSKDPLHYAGCEGFIEEAFTGPIKDYKACLLICSIASNEIVVGDIMSHLKFFRDTEQGINLCVALLGRAEIAQMVDARLDVDGWDADCIRRMADELGPKAAHMLGTHAAGGAPAPMQSS